ncbi:MAG TPA: ATP-binding protein [Acidimicrobiia bacterium]|nr:ATP-binding protein [Acidimicrobiia bacterium]
MARGRLRIYLGAAPGVGKTFAMLNEGRRRHSRGTDVVVGLVETHGRENTAAQLGDLEVMPRHRVHYRDRDFEEMDVDAIIARHPTQVLVDELAHTNVPGSRNEKRWQDVDEILDAGIDVISTLNIQHLESVNDLVERITGVKQHETIPDAQVRVAEQVELVDMTPEALRRRMAHGNIYPSERVDSALANYFRPGNLAALRELALLWVADRVDESLQQYMEDHGIATSWETRERVVVALTGATAGDDLIRRAARMAQRTRGDLLGVHIRNTSGLAEQRDDARLAEHRQLLEALGGTYHEVAGDDIGRALVEFAKAERATQLVIGASRRTRWTELLRGSVVSRVIRQSDTIDVHVISSTAPEPERVTIGPLPRPPRGPSRRREIAGWALGLAGLPLLTLILTAARSSVGLSGALLLYVLLVVAVAGVGGLRPGVTASVASFVLADYYFSPPLHQLTINRSEDVIALIVLVVLGVTVSALVTVSARRSAEAAHAKAEARTMARLSGSVIGAADPLGVLIGRLRDTFGIEAAAVLRREGDGWRLETSAGEPVPERPEDGDLTIPLDDDEQLVLRGAGLDPEDLTLLEVFTGQLSLALESRQLRAEAALASGLAEADRFRTALLAAVSHDLRTPLASIKASVTSLLQQDVEWPPEVQRELLEAIDRGSDRLTSLINNLLDMGRLQTGTLEPVLRDVGFEEVVPAVMTELPDGASHVVLDLPETLPRVHADASLLERAVANVIENALQWSPNDQQVRVSAGSFGSTVDLRVVDCGPGVAAEQREAIFRPFQRLGDSPNGAGVGLGLAVARGFVEAMGGRVSVDDTPGGGLTVTMSLPRAEA